MEMRILLGLALIVACSACDKKAEGQSVAVVNNEEITASELNAELTAARVPDNADKKSVTSRILQSLIDRRLLAAEARSVGIDKSPEFVSRQRRLNEELLIGMLANRQMDAGKLPSDQEITAIQNKLPQSFAKREVWSLDQLQYATPTDKAVQARIVQTKTLAQLADVLTQSGIAFQRGRNQLNTSVIPAQIYDRLVAIPEGEPFVVPNGARSVASVITTRQPAPLVGANARTEAVNMIRRQSGTQLLENRLKELRQAAKIDYKEGFAPSPKK